MSAPRLFYLHGFASSPASGKAVFFARHLAAHGLRLECLDLNLPDFESLTVSRMIAQLDEAVDRCPPGPVVLIGSSLGGFVALHDADRRNRVTGQQRPVSALVLLAPALDFGRDPRMEPILDEWRVNGTREVFHFGEGRMRRIAFGLYEDARAYDSSQVRLDIPILVFQGRRDDVVPPAGAMAFAEGRQNVTLQLLDDDHRLQAHLSQIWQETERFLGLVR